MYTFIQELPEDKRGEYNTLLNFFSFQLKCRDMNIAHNIIAKAIVNLEVSTHIPKKYRDEATRRIRSVGETSRYTFTVPEIDKKSLEEILGKQRDKQDINGLKH